MNDEVFIHPDLIQYFLLNKEINDYFFKFEKNYKTYIRRFYDNAENLMIKFLPPGLLRNLKVVLEEMSNILKGECYKDTEIPCLRSIQFLHHQDSK